MTNFLRDRAISFFIIVLLHFFWTVGLAIRRAAADIISKSPEYKGLSLLLSVSTICIISLLLLYLFDRHRRHSRISCPQLTYVLTELFIIVMLSMLLLTSAIAFTALRRNFLCALPSSVTPCYSFLFITLGSWAFAILYIAYAVHFVHHARHAKGSLWHTPVRLVQWSESSIVRANDKELAPCPSSSYPTLWPYPETPYPRPVDPLEGTENYSYFAACQAEAMRQLKGDAQGLNLRSLFIAAANRQPGLGSLYRVGLEDQRTCGYS